RDIFVKDLQTGSIARVSVGGGTPGTEANGPSFNPSISGDGRYVAFESLATNLVAGDSRGYRDIFVRDRVAGTTVRVSVATGTPGAEANAGSENPAISADGLFVAFDSNATNLVAGDGNARSDVFVRALATSATTRVSLTNTGAQAAGSSFDPSISADGRYVAFESEAANLVPGDTLGHRDIFVRDRTDATTVRVSVTAGGAQATGDSLNTAISGDGAVVAFESYAANLVGGDTNGTVDVFARGRTGSPATHRVNVSSGGVQAASGAFNPSLTHTGRFVSFDSAARNLVSGDANAADDVFVRDRTGAVTFRASVSSAGAAGNGHSRRGSIALVGSAITVAYDSIASNLVAGDRNGAMDVFAAERLSVPARSVTIEHDAAGVTFDRFVTGRSTAYSGGGYVYGRWAGTRLAVRFTGTAIRWYGPKGPGYGTAEIRVNGVPLEEMADAYAVSQTPDQVIYEVSGLANGRHTLEIRPTGQRNPASSGAIVVIDYFEVEGPSPTGGGTRLDETAGRLSGSWIRGVNGAYINGAYHYSRHATASITVRFTGTRIAWIGPRTNAYGRAQVLVNDRPIATVSQFNRTTGWRESVWESPVLTRGTHTLTIRPTGTKDAASRGTIIVVDAFDVTP
ncbi:MAG TPA: hypothetical protein VFH17_02530, partial [Coriobacteriia bacterium]|nr:hypothetical protein [Coriobacteriia bacterium]